MKNNECLRHRIWSKTYKKMLFTEAFHGNYYTEHRVGKVVCGIHAESIGKSFRSTPMLFTGKYDMKNNPVYEGDIVQNDSWNDKGKTTPCLYEVFWNDKVIAFGTRPLQNVMYMSFTLEESKVVGNIYENPDLLKSELSVGSNPADKDNKNSGQA